VSRQVDITKPLSDLDRAYLTTYGHHREIALADEMSGEGPAVADLEQGRTDKGYPEQGEDESNEEWVNRLTVPELRAAITDLAEEGYEIDKNEKKAGLQAILFDLIEPEAPQA
jgi:hypothetical protein